MTNDQALSPRLWPDPFHWGNFTDVFSQGADLALRAEHDRSTRCSRRSACSSRASRSPTRSRGCAGAGRDAVFVLVLVAMMLPPQVTVVPVYVLCSKLHLVGSLWPLIIPNLLGDAFSIFLLRQFFLTIPEEYVDAARVDGCGEFRILVDGRPAAGEAGDRGRRAVRVPVLLQRLLRAAPVHGREPAALDAVARPRRSSARSTRCSGT